MKATIEKVDDLYIIRLFNSEKLFDVFVVDKIELPHKEEINIPSFLRLIIGVTGIS